MNAGRLVNTVVVASVAAVLSGLGLAVAGSLDDARDRAHRSPVVRVESAAAPQRMADEVAPKVTPVAAAPSPTGVTSPTAKPTTPAVKAVKVRKPVKVVKADGKVSSTKKRAAKKTTARAATTTTMRSAAVAEPDPAPQPAAEVGPDDPIRNTPPPAIPPRLPPAPPAE